MQNTLSTTQGNRGIVEHSSAIVQGGIIMHDLQAVERHMIAVLYDIWKLQGVNKKIVTLKGGTLDREAV